MTTHEILRHKKTGGLYEVLFRAARVRAHRSLLDYDLVLIVRHGEAGEVIACSSMLNAPAGASLLFAAVVQSSAPLVHGAEIVVYRALGGGPVWVRPTSEMDDGRFEPAGAAQSPSSTPGEVERLVDALIEAADINGLHQVHGTFIGSAQAATCLAAARTALLSRISTAGRGESYQDRVYRHFLHVAGDDPTDLPERRDRANEEFAELMQSLGGTLDGWIAIGRYVWGRPIGEPSQEMGGTLNTLAALAAWARLDMMACAEAELARTMLPEVVAKIRRKRANRHGRGVLPGQDAALSAADATNPQDQE